MQRITKINLLINYPSGENNSRKSEKNNLTIVLIVLYAKKYIYPDYVSKHN